MDQVHEWPRKMIVDDIGFGTQLSKEGEGISGKTGGRKLQVERRLMCHMSVKSAGIQGGRSAQGQDVRLNAVSRTSFCNGVDCPLYAPECIGMVGLEEMQNAHNRPVAAG